MDDQDDSHETDQDRAAVALLREALDSRQRALWSALFTPALWRAQITHLVLDFIVCAAFSLALTVAIGYALHQSEFAVDREFLRTLALTFFIVALPPRFVFFGKNYFTDHANSAFDKVIHSSGFAAKVRMSATGQGNER